MNWVHKMWLANNVHVQNVQNGVVVGGMRGDLCHSSRMKAFRTNSNVCFLLNPTRSTVVVLDGLSKVRNVLKLYFMASSNRNYPSFFTTLFIITLPG